jgi:hypothetical protein
LQIICMSLVITELRLHKMERSYLAAKQRKSYS